MGLFGKDAPAARRGRVLRASGFRITSSTQETVRVLASARQDWQGDAWGYRDMIGELRFGLQFRSRAVSRVKYFAAQVMPEEDEPIPLNTDKGVKVPAALRAAAEEELARLPLDQGYGFLGVLDENFGVTGEAWLHGKMDGGEEKWEIHSVDEVRAGSDGRVSLRPYGNASYDIVDTNREEMLRMWVPHPRYKILADSPMRSLLNVCEEIVLAGQEMRSASRSRSATNGILLIPDGLTLLNALKNDTSLVEDDDFMAELTATLLAPISNEGDPGQVAPAVIQGEAEMLDKVRHIRFERETSGDLLGRIDKGLERLARGLDIPPEVVSGLGQANHWSAWQIDASTYRYHIDPAVRIIADSLTEGFLRPALLARGFTREQVKLVQVWYDAGNITENPNRGQDAKDAYDRGAIGFAALRQALGFNDADAPSDDEVLQMVALKIGIDPGTSALLMAQLFGGGKIDVTPPKPEVQQVPSQRTDQEPEQRKGITAPGETPPDNGTPEQPVQASGFGKALLAAVLNAGEPETAPVEEWIVDERGGRTLLEIDRALRDRIQEAADAAMSRALEKAGARIKSKANKNKALAAVLADADVWHAGQAAGRQAVLALGISERELLEGAFAALEEKVRGWVLAAIEAAIAAVLKMLRAKPDSPRGRRVAERLRQSMAARADSGWAFLLNGLNRQAERRLFHPEPDIPDEGEFTPGSLVPLGLVRGALAIIGGTADGSGGVDDDGRAATGDRPVGGIGLGQEVTDALVDEGAAELGFEWVYGVTPRGAHFPPHVELDGERFGSWADAKLKPTAQYAWVGSVYRPGDHVGCGCDTLPVWAIPKQAEVLHDRLAVDTPGMAEVRALAEADDAAGRTGTTAQETRDQRDRILKLRKRFIEQGAQ